MCLELHLCLPGGTVRRYSYTSADCLLAGFVLLPLCALILACRWVGIMVCCAWEAMR